MIEIKRLPEFDEWLDGIKDNMTRIRLNRRLDKVQRGNWGDIKPLQDGVWEMREFFGSGWRMYYIQHGDVVIVMLGGGDKSTQQQLLRGQILTEILKQPQFSPIPVEKQVCLIIAATSGVIDDIPLNKLKQFEEEYMNFLELGHRNILSSIAEHKELIPETATALKNALESFVAKFKASLPK